METALWIALGLSVAAAGLEIFSRVWLWWIDYTCRRDIRDYMRTYPTQRNEKKEDER